MKKFECDVCKKRFDTETALRQHKNAKHFHESKPTVAESKAETTSISIDRRTIKKLAIPVLIILVLGGISYGFYKGISNPNQIGPLGSTHIHADFALFLDGREITPLSPQYFVRSRYAHVEEGPGAGTVIHMHARNVPLSLFFNSLSMKFDSNCFVTDTNEKFCNEGNKTLKMYVKHKDGEWEQNFEYEKYIYKDLDKILISYGDETLEELQAQMDAVTDFSKDNAGRQMELD